MSKCSGLLSCLLSEEFRGDVALIFVYITLIYSFTEILHLCSFLKICTFESDHNIQTEWKNRRDFHTCPSEEVLKAEVAEAGSEQ